MSDPKVKIKNLSEIKAITKRIAWQIFEEHYQDKKIFLVGIAPKGVKFAKMIQDFLNIISDIQIDFIELELDKVNPAHSVKIIPEQYDINSHPIVLIDDVLNSGKTMIYAVGYFLKDSPSKIKTAVLVNRSHGEFPVKVDFKGLSLSTTSQEHIEVFFEGKTSGIYLK
ncbi:MAG: phosphoribosyltransferase family protein [Flavobacteriaceae bacterium]|nr:phosphoribosyltransferase family protein [Flavobacteriaceae bacterium]MCY4216460.1 phosphoribosyltransferase family protein [Flavobacteriaceae bacterium]MCY4253957.1 phosphoribosyltransferase family protein [Flavobacteriaceae bacterium]